MFEQGRAKQPQEGKRHMPKIMPFQKKEEHSDMKEYTRKLRRHRMGVLSRFLVCILVVAAAAFVLSRYYANKTYETFEVVSSVEHADTINTRYQEYGESLLRYSKDGISCLDLQHQSIWSQTFNMQDPILHVCEHAAAVADRGGNQLYIFDETGLKGQVDTLLPIEQVVTSRQGVTAVLLEDSSVSWIYLYDQTGKKLVEARCNLAETGQPMSLSLSADASKLAVSYLQVSGGTANSCVVFYNLGSVGANFVDKIVSSKLYEDTLIPRVQYLDADTCVAIGENGFYLYEGAEIPEETKAELVEGEIQSVCFGESEFGLVYEQEGEIPYLVRVFDEEGNALLEQPFDLKYDQIKLSSNEVIIYNDADCVIYSDKGILRYEGTFTESLVNLYKLRGKRYVVIHPQKTEQIKLK